MSIVAKITHEVGENNVGGVTTIDKSNNFCWASGQKGRIHVEFYLSMEEKCKGEEEGATIEEEASKEREECCDRRRKVKKKTKRRSGMRKIRQIRKLR